MQDGVNWSTNNLFGSIANQSFPFPTNVGFIPEDDKGNVIDIKGDGAIWRGLTTSRMQYWAYCFCSPLASVIDRLADADINGMLRIMKGKKEDSNSAVARRVKKLLNQPNPLYSWYEYRSQQVTYKKIYGYTLVYAMNYSLNDRSTSQYLWNLNPLYCTPIKNDDFDLFKSPNRIKEWILTIGGETYTLPAEKVLILKDSSVERDFDQLGLPLSKVAGLDWAVSNVCAAMEADNVLLRKKGPLGFISQDSGKDPVAGYVALTPKEKIEIQNDLQKYGLTWSKFQYVVSRHGIRWNPMSFNVRDLDTKGTIKGGIDMICDRFSYPAELMSGKNATYENRTSAERYLYNTVTIPQNLRDMHTTTTWLNMEDDYIFCDFSDYPALQDNRVSQGESIKYATEGYQQQFYDGVISLNTYRRQLEEPPVDGEDNLYYGTQDYITKYGKNIAPKSAGA